MVFAFLNNCYWLFSCSWCKFCILLDAASHPKTLIPSSCINSNVFLYSLCSLQILLSYPIGAVMRLMFELYSPRYLNKFFYETTLFPLDSYPLYIVMESNRGDFMFVLTLTNKIIENWLGLIFISLSVLVLMQIKANYYYNFLMIRSVLSFVTYSSQNMCFKAFKLEN